MGTNGAGEGNRTLATSLEGWGSTTELHPHVIILDFIGGGDWIRTSESTANGFTVRPLWPTREPLHKWSWRKELNPQPTDYKSVALPIELRQHIIFILNGDLEGTRTLDLQRDRLAF